MSRINILTGHAGSGKTEIAINCAVNLAKRGEKVAVVDMDIVNPYFCIRDIKKELEDTGVRVIAADAKLSNAELMVVPPEVISVFDDKSYKVIMDVGGDDRGAIVLGQYNGYFKKEEYSMYFVINNNRPLTIQNKSVEDYMQSIERASRLKVTHLISNTNMSYETTPLDIIKGDGKVLELSQKINIPYKYVVCLKKLEEEVKNKVHAELLTIDTYMKPPWA
ncbi:ATP-binding protein [Clostridium fermenticellae]|uniref:ATP-binding protein n=1 Tax=Clostridium fermenticellae TaxID=2068654 RepID=A0A386H0V5_9CLOT|nr:P-loop NTPase [Clostridium fermenticellae]AYD39309.1 ATP-binding protein [Clostridium fermenticellae]